MNFYIGPMTTHRTSLIINMLFTDRVGIVADISKIIAAGGMNITAMEVKRKQNMADVYIKADPNASQYSKKEVFNTLSEIKTLRSIRFIKTMPNEKRENTFRVVLDNVSDGIISIDRKGRIATINKVARKILNCENKPVVGKKINETDLPETAIFQCLESNTALKNKQNIITEKGRFQFLSAARPIMDSGNHVIGAVEIMKDMKEIKALAKEVSQSEEVTFSDFLGLSPGVKLAVSFAHKIAKTDSIVSVRGESGAGKELLARAIHRESGKSGPFIPVNCAALHESLLESELFGYEGGAFTGAVKDGKAGLFEQAGGGTLFLDEIGEMPPGPQAKILRVIQEHKIRKIGGSNEIPIDARIITATNRNLEKMVETGQFRKDLYYRINVLPIHIPPLKERIPDIPILAEHFLFQLNLKLDKNPQKLSQSALNKLMGHAWPGNVRELKNVIERAAILNETQTIEENSILFGPDLVSRSIDKVKNSIKGNSEESLSLQLSRVEKQIIKQAMKNAPSIRKAAIKMGISHTALRNKIKKHDL